MSGGVAFLNGKRADAVDASAGRLLGLTCFETLAARDGEPFHQGAHLARLEGSMRTLGLAVDGGTAAIADQLARALAAFGPGPATVRVSVHATGTPKGLVVPDEGADVLVLVGEPRYEALSGGVAAVTSTVRAPAPESWPSHVKAPCLPRLLAFREAARRGAFEALLLDAKGNVVSGARSNVFALAGDRLVTPPTPPAFPGVTRGHVLAAAREAGLDVQEGPVHRDALPEADELFLTLTGPGVVPLTTLDGAPVGGGKPGLVTARLDAATPSL